MQEIASGPLAPRNDERPPFYPFPFTVHHPTPFTTHHLPLTIIPNQTLSLHHPGARMTTAAATRDYDYTEIPFITRQIFILGIFEAVTVVIFALVSRWMDGPLESILEALILVIGLSILAFLPGIWTRAISIEGIAGAAGIAFGATVVFTAIDAILLQNVGLYTNRWLAIGGGSGWWYLPPWWMFGTLIPMLGAWSVANQTVRRGGPSFIGLSVMGLALVLIVGALAAITHFPPFHGAIANSAIPHARWTVPSFAVMTIPALMLLVAVTSFGAKRHA